MSESAGRPQPSVDWFAGGFIDRERKLSDYLLSSTHPDGRNKLRLWRNVFGIGEGDAELLERLIREQRPRSVGIPRRHTYLDQGARIGREDHPARTSRQTRHKGRTLSTSW